MKYDTESGARIVDAIGRANGISPTDAAAIVRALRNATSAGYTDATGPLDYLVAFGVADSHLIAAAGAFDAAADVDDVDVE